MANRGNFSGRLGFILAAAGSAVGLGNIWKFPYLAGNNGGAGFLLIYLLCIFLLCFPILVGEVAIGRKVGSDAYGSYRQLGGRSWGLLGLFGILCGIFILSFYNVVAGWAFGYFLNISFGDLLAEPDLGTYFGTYVNDILDVSSLAGLANSNFIFSLVFMILTAIIVSRGIQKGIEAANKIMMPTLYVILLCLIVYGFTLPNAMAGVEFYLVPKINNIKPQTIFYALQQAFFSLSLGMGALITYGSYFKKDQNIVSSAAIISFADTMVAFLSGLMVFPLVFSLGAEPGQGPKLIFVILTEAFQQMGPVVGRVVGGGFFLLICFAALTSTVSLLEVPAAYLVDQKKLDRKKVVWAMALLIFVLGLPSMLSQGLVPALNKLPIHRSPDFLTFVADTSDLALTIGGCLMCIFISTRWGMGNLDTELAEGNPRYMKSAIRGYLHITIRFVCPILLGALSLLILFDKLVGIETIPWFR